MTTLNQYVIIVAGGSGTRFGACLPKQFVILHGRPILMHTVERFSQALPGARMIIVLPHEQFNTWHELCTQYNFCIEHSIVSGGSTRYHSVLNALQTISLEPMATNAVIGIHDGVRPLLSVDLIRRCYADAAQWGSAVPAVEVTDTVRLLQDGGECSSMLPRAQLRAVQTPQVFAAQALLKAYQAPYQDLFTDDASVYQAMHKHVRLVPGETSNIKITTPTDLYLAECIFNSQLAQLQKDT